MITSLQQMQELHRLKQIMEGNYERVDMTALEQHFLLFSTYNTKKALVVNLPKLYTLEGDEVTHLREAFAGLGLSSKELPAAIDIAGEFEYDTEKEVLIFLAPTQFQADHYSTLRTYLNPLVEQIYSEGIGLLRDFTKHEAVVGIVEATRGDVNIREIPLFPERFKRGPYQLKVELDTPTKTITKFKDLGSRLNVYTTKAQESMLDRTLIEETTRKAVELRKILGSLSRYEQPEKTTFAVATNSCVVRSTQHTLFYLYAEEQKRNMVIYFGDDPFAKGKRPDGLEVYAADGQQQTLAALVQAGLYNPSVAVLQQRISDLQQLYDNARRGMKQQSEEGVQFEVLLTELQNVQDTISPIVNPDMQRKYMEKVNPELLEFMVCPSHEDGVLYELLPRLSWNKTIRGYHHTLRFMRKFQEAEIPEQRDLLRRVIANVILDTNQNNDINVWLYQNHKQFCFNEGIYFDVKE